MNPKKTVFKTICLALILSFFAHDLAWAVPEISAFVAPAFSLQASDVKVNPDFAKISETHSAEGNRLLIHIQDAHANFGAQKNIANALEELITRHHVQTVFVEGGTKDDSLNFLRPLAPPALRERVAKKYLMNGEISGAEYLDLSSAHDMRLLGVEDAALYEKNLKAYAAVAKDREKALEFLDEIGKRTERLKRQIYPAHILSRDEFLRKFHKN